MLLRIILVLMCLVFFPLSAGVYEMEGHDRDSYLEDIEFLLQELREDPDNLELREQLIRFYYVTEQFDEAVSQCEIFKRKASSLRFRNRDREKQIDYTRIISLACSSRYDEAVSAVDTYIRDYEPSEEVIRELRNRQDIYRSAERTRSFPVIRTAVAENTRTLGTVPGQDTIIVYSETTGSVQVIDSNGGTSRMVSLPELNNQEDILNISINSAANLCCISYRRSNGASIAVSEKTGSSWGPLNQVSVLNEGSINSYPSFMPDGRTVLFCSNRNENSGIDLYSTKNTGGEWSEPEPVSGINGSRDEASVYVHPDGNMVFFSSNSRPGLGGFDLYSATLNTNAGGISADSVSHIPSINTFKNEVTPPYITSVRNTALFSHTSAGNTILHQLEPDFYQTSPQDIAPITEGSFVARDIQFDTDSTSLRQSSYEFLSRLYEYLSENPDKTVIIAGHTDNTGSEQYNIELSKKRAQAVRDYLVRRGIESRRITIRGYGTSKPVAENSTETGRQQNRRVEITISSD